MASLVRVLGPHRLDLAEDVVQEALARALRVWPADGVPRQPHAWVFRVAHNLALDSLRRRKITTNAGDEIANLSACEPQQAENGIADDTLQMMFACCHPAVPVETRLPLLLKTTGGFDVGAIAAALRTRPGTIAQRLTRAKAHLAELRVSFEVPGSDQLPQRLPLVLEVLYLIFNEGYRAHRGQDLIRRHLIEESVRLCSLLLDLPQTTQPEVHALLALMLLLGARQETRTNDLGELLTLAEQDRSRWDRRWLGLGLRQFRLSIGGETLTRWHIEAAIASIHAAAPTYAATDWVALSREYDRLLQLHDTPIVRLNRAVAIAKVDGIRAALAELDRIERAPSLVDYVLLPATRAHLLWQIRDFEGAAHCLTKALTMPASDPERALLEKRLQACRAHQPPPPW